MEFIIYIILEIPFRHKLWTFWLLTYSFKKSKTNSLFSQKKCCSHTYSDLKSQWGLPDTSVQRQPASLLHLKSSQFIFLIKTCQYNREQLFSETLSHSAVDFALAVWGCCVECGKEVSFSSLLNLYFWYHGAKFKNHFDSVKRIWRPNIYSHFFLVP